MALLPVRGEGIAVAADEAEEAFDGTVGSTGDAFDGEGGLPGGKTEEGAHGGIGHGGSDTFGTAGDLHAAQFGQQGVERTVGEVGIEEDLSGVGREEGVVEREGFVGGEAQPFDVDEVCIGGKFEGDGGFRILAGAAREDVAVLFEALGDDG